MPKVIQTSDAETPEELPVFKPFSWGMVRQLSVLQMRYQAAVNDESANVDDRIARMEALMDQIQGLLGSRIISLPRSWLVDDAPEDLDFSDPTALNWLNSEYFEQLVGFVAGQRAAKNAKN